MVRRIPCLAAVVALLGALLCPAQAVPPERLGVYHWLGQTPFPFQNSPRPSDSLDSALASIRALGFGSARIFAGGRYDYVRPLRDPARFREVREVPEPVTLTSILALSRYQRFLNAPELRTIWLTAYPVFDFGQGPDEIDLTREVSDAEWQQEYSQLKQAVEWLYLHYGGSGKLILISNNESDWKMQEVLDAGGTPQLAIGNMTRDMETRFRAVRDARNEFPSAQLKVFFGPEIALWKLDLAAGFNALEQVLPNLDYDFISFSSWETESGDHPGALLAAAVDDIAVRTRANVSPDGAAFFGGQHVLIGEFGYAREWGLASAQVSEGIGAVTEAIASGRVPYAVYWQLYDNLFGNVKRFGLIDPLGNLTPAGRMMRTRLTAPR